MTNMFYVIMSFLIGGCFCVGLMCIAYKDSYDEGYRDAWMEAHNYGVKKKKSDD